MRLQIEWNPVSRADRERVFSFISFLLQAFIVVLIFAPVYCIFFDLILAELGDNAGYDASRFLYAALNEGMGPQEGQKEQLLIDLLVFTSIARFPFYCLILLYISAFLMIWSGVSLTKTIGIILFSPAFIVYLETGKDVLIVTSLLAFFSMFYFDGGLYRRGFFARLFFLAIIFGILLLSIAVKGVTLSIYIALSIIFYLEIKGRLSVFVVSIVLAASFLGGLAVRGLVEYEDIVNLTAFSHEWLISSEINFFLIFKALARFVIYSSSPIWYWLIAIKKATFDSSLIFHVWGYLMMFFCFFKYRWWKLQTYYIAAMAFSLSYPFVHLRYFFTFLVFLCFAQMILNSVKFDRKLLVSTGTNNT